MNQTGSQGFTWDRESTKILILGYETNPNLYLTNDPGYKLKNKRADALNNIKSILFDNGYDVKTEDINKKIHNMRTQFFKEHQKVKKQVVSGAGTTDLYVPKAWWYDLLKFLINSDPVRKSRSNLPAQPGSSSMDRQLSPDLLSSPTNSSLTEDESMVYETTVDELEEGVYVPHITKTPKRKKSASLLEEQTKALFKDASNALNKISKNKTETNEFKAFSDMIAEEIKKIGNEEEIRSVKRQILNCVLDAQERVQRSQRSEPETD